MPPSPFVIQWAGRVAPIVPAPRRALDVAIGRGRHTAALASAGFRPFGVDRDLGALCAARARVVVPLRLWCADLERLVLPVDRFELVLVARYLQRNLFDALAAAVVPGGVILYETFTTLQRELGAGPTAPEHLLNPGELERRFSDREGFEVLFSEETMAPEALARVVARRLP